MYLRTNGVKRYLRTLSVILVLALIFSLLPTGIMTVKADGGECEHNWRFRKIHEDVNSSDSSTIENKIYAYCTNSECTYLGDDSAPDETVKNSYKLWMEITANNVKYTGSYVSLDDQLVNINVSSDWESANIVVDNAYFTASKSGFYDESEVEIDPPINVSTGNSEYEVRIYIPGHDEDEEPPYVSAKFAIIKGDIGGPNSEIATKGGIVYSGSSQKLIATAPDYLNYSITGIKYYFSVNNSTPSADIITIDDWNDVTAADAGTYYIFYKVYVNSSYEDKVCGPFEVEIARADQTAPPGPTAEPENIGTKTVTLSAISTTDYFGNALYAKNTENSAPAEDSLWQESTVFTGLTPNTTYYFFSKISGDANHNPAVSIGNSIKTNALTTPAAPSGLTAVAPASANGNDGKITGISTGMEYSVLQSGGAYSAYTDAEGTEITGLSGGTTVKVRFKSTEDANASEDVTLTVPQYTDPNGNNGGSSNDSPVISNDTTNKDKKAEDTAGKTATDENDITASEEAKKNVGIKLDKKLDATVDETGVSFKWGKVKKADGYIVMSAYGKKPLKKIGTVTGATNKSFKIEMIDGKPVVTSKKIKLRVKAYKIVDGKKVILGKSSVYKVKAIN